MTSPLPPLLQQLLAAGVWSTPGADCDSRVPVDVARRWDPVSGGIHLIDRPHPLSLDVAAVPLLDELWNLVDVDPAQLLVIADFGLGSDNPIVLDLSISPAVGLTQQWTDPPPARPSWVTIAETFDDFAAALGLEDPLGDAERET